MADRRITVAKGDGIGPEITEACIKVLDAAGAPLAYDYISVGKEAYLSGHSSGITKEAWAAMAKNGVFLKGPITTPQGGGYKSLNVTIRKSMGLFANVRPVKSLAPFIETTFPDMDIVVIRENEEDLYAGIEHQQTQEVVQCLKLVSRPGCEKIVRYAFEYARAYGRKKVTCMSKDNIMKQTDGMFHAIFDKMSKEYPDIESDHYIIDIGSARIANNPEQFDIIVTLNLYGDIISDITAEIAGSVGLGGSANVGTEFSMFEAIHGSAPDIAGKNIANPSGLIHGACMMLVHLNMPEYAEKILSALYCTIEDGVHTGDMRSDHTRELVGTAEFAQAIIDRLGREPKKLNVTKPTSHKITIDVDTHKDVPKALVGVDMFLDWKEGDRDADKLGKMLEALEAENLVLKMITNRGVKVYPDGRDETFHTDHWRCRFVAKEMLEPEAKGKAYLEDICTYRSIITLCDELEKCGLNFIKLENLYYFQGKRCYSQAQGE